MLTFGFCNVLYIKEPKARAKARTLAGIRVGTFLFHIYIYTCSLYNDVFGSCI
jgi:hypothetical protein